MRLALKTDISAIKPIVVDSDLFPVEYLEGMMSDYLDNPKSEELWYVAEAADDMLGFGYCIPEKFTEGTYNLLAVAVASTKQGQGYGKQMIHFLEEHLQKKGGRILLIETSSGDDYKLTRKFYEYLNYIKEASIRDYWSEGESKVIYLKKLNN